MGRAAEAKHLSRRRAHCSQPGEIESRTITASSRCVTRRRVGTAAAAAGRRKCCRNTCATLDHVYPLHVYHRPSLSPRILLTVCRTATRSNVGHFKVPNSCFLQWRSVE
ncbi:hypothetical protein MRX96_010314 [Rhipicephalus microplus]